MRKLLEGKVALITGGSKGIGEAIAVKYVEEGAKVAITARGKADLDRVVAKLREMGGEAIGIVADQASSEDCLNVYKTVLDTFGDLDTVVLNAGISDQVKIEATPDELFDMVYQVNLKGPFMYCREAVKYFLPKKKGSIVVVSSVNGVRPMCGVSYSTSKGGLNHMALSTAIRLVGTGVRINTICPGYTVTPLSNMQEKNAGIPEAGTEFDPMKTEDRMNPPEDVSMLPILRTRTVRGIGTMPEDQANAALFFSSDLSSCINGQVVRIDCGCYL